MIRKKLTEQQRAEAAYYLHRATVAQGESWDALRDLEKYIGDVANGEKIISATCADVLTVELRAERLSDQLKRLREFCQQAERE